LIKAKSQLKEGRRNLPLYFFPKGIEEGIKQRRICDIMNDPINEAMKIIEGVMEEESRKNDVGVIVIVLDGNGEIYSKIKNMNSADAVYCLETLKILVIKDEYVDPEEISEGEADEEGEGGEGEGEIERL
jgi:hypothetical protein